MTRITWRYWGRQLLSMAGLLVTAVYMVTIAYSLASDSFRVHEFWLWVSLVFVIERVVTVRERGWKRMLLAASMYELLFDFLLQACHAKAYLDSVFRRERAW
ncbi:hypothetical protein [Streptomyces hirsutus]|uniref:hypothetical protein n=1 Tax=Streptomyces hirsutus TaxID=35620 RepID=UPI0036B6B80A